MAHTPHSATPDRRDQLLSRLAAERREPDGRPGQPGPRIEELWSATSALSRHADCPTPGDVELLIAGALRGRKQERVRAHLEVCGTCRGYAQRLQEAARRPVPPVTAPPPARGEISLGHVLGLALAGILLLTANTAIIDVLAGLEVAAPVERSLSLPPETQPVPATSLHEVTNDPVSTVVQPDESEVEQPETPATAKPGQAAQSSAERGKVTTPAETNSGEQAQPVAGSSEASPAAHRLEPDVRS